MTKANILSTYQPGWKWKTEYNAVLNKDSVFMKFNFWHSSHLQHAATPTDDLDINKSWTKLTASVLKLDQNAKKVKKNVSFNYTIQSMKGDFTENLRMFCIVSLK